VLRAAGPDNSSLPDCVQAKHRGRTSENYPSRDCLKKRGDKGIAYASVHEKELPYQPY
jgi:hypothetical protein